MVSNNIFSVLNFVIFVNFKKITTSGRKNYFLIVVNYYYFIENINKLLQLVYKNSNYQLLIKVFAISRFCQWIIQYALKIEDTVTLVTPLYHVCQEIIKKVQYNQGH